MPVMSLATTRTRYTILDCSSTSIGTRYRAFPIVRVAGTLPVLLARTNRQDRETTTTVQTLFLVGFVFIVNTSFPVAVRDVVDFKSRGGVLSQKWRQKLL